MFVFYIVVLCGIHIRSKYLTGSRNHPDYYHFEILGHNYLGGDDLTASLKWSRFQKEFLPSQVHGCLHWKLSQLCFITSDGSSETSSKIKKFCYLTEKLSDANVMRFNKNKNIIAVTVLFFTPSYFPTKSIHYLAVLNTLDFEALLVIDCRLDHRFLWVWLKNKYKTSIMLWVNSTTGKILKKRLVNLALFSFQYLKERSP